MLTTRSIPDMARRPRLSSSRTREPAAIRDHASDDGSAGENIATVV